MTQLSNRQYSLLNHFVRAVLRMPVSEAAKLNQCSFGSLIHRNLIAYSPGHGFHATRLGHHAQQLAAAAYRLF